MTKGPDVRDLLRALEPPPKPRKEKWVAVEEYLGEIYAARDRRVPWAMIAKTLADNGIEVTSVDLRVFVSKIKRDAEKYGKPKVSRKSRKTVVRKAGGTRVVKRPVLDEKKNGTADRDKDSPVDVGLRGAKKPETDRPLAAAPEEHAATRRAGRKP